jgi:tRNA(fMet)-specific endonuclease VapC
VSRSPVIYLLDADTVIAGMHAETPVRQRLQAARDAGGEIALSAISLYRLRHSIARGPRRFEERAQLRAFLAAGIAVIAFDAEDAAMAGELQFALDAAGTPIGAYDLLIAAQALRRGAVLVAPAASTPARIPGLVSEDWLV